MSGYAFRRQDIASETASVTFRACVVYFYSELLLIVYSRWERTRVGECLEEDFERVQSRVSLNQEQPFGCLEEDFEWVQPQLSRKQEQPFEYLREGFERVQSRVSM